MNYFQIAFRNLWKNKSFTIINIVGLAIGMSISLLALLFVTNELSFDRFHVKKDRIHRVITKIESSTRGTEISGINTAGVGLSFLQEIPEIEAMVRTTQPQRGFFTFSDENFNNKFILYADSSFFKVFSFPLILGNSETVLDQKYKIVLTENLAMQIFGDANNAMGKIISLNNKDNLQVTGIMKNIPLNSHVRFDALISFNSQDTIKDLGWNGGWQYCTYLLLHENADVENVENQFVPIAEENINKYQNESWNYFLQPLVEVHLNNTLDWDISSQGSITNIILYLAVSFIILLIACINFINLTTAASLKRMKEVGVRKVTGATRQNIIWQFLTETILISIIALVHAIILIEIFYLWLTWATGDISVLENFELYNKSFLQLAGVIIFLIFSVGLMAGAYPAFYMSGFNPALAVKGRIKFNKGNSITRSWGLVFQFSISIISIICTLIIATQLNYLLKTDKGFDPTNKIVIPLTSESTMDKVNILKDAFLGIPGIEKAGASSGIPGRGYTRNGYLPEGLSDHIMIHVLDVDYDYLPTMGLEIIKGRSFSKEFGLDKDAYLINEALALQLGWDIPIGKTIRRGGEHKVIGVVKNYNFSPLHVNIEPLIFTLKPWQGYEYITLQTSGMQNDFKSELEKKWKSVVPYEDFNSFTLTSHVRKAYNSVKGNMYMLLVCSILSILIAVLGLYGLTAFTTRQRYKEIAIRKVYGADMKKIFNLVSSGFIKWVVVANIIAWPVAYFIMDNYFLANFAHNTGIKWWVFVLALVFSITISLLVILVQILRLSRLNPIDYIRYE